MKIAREIYDKHRVQESEVSTTQDVDAQSGAAGQQSVSAMDVQEGERAGFDADTGMVRDLELIK